jgi:hypothetical protein
VKKQIIHGRKERNINNPTGVKSNFSSRTFRFCVKWDFLNVLIDLVESKEFGLGVKLSVSVGGDLEGFRKVNETVSIDNRNVKLIFGSCDLKVAGAVVSTFL